MLPSPPKTQLKSFLISPPVRERMDAGASGDRIPVIISLVQVETGPEQGVSFAKRKVKEFLKCIGYVVDDSSDQAAPEKKIRESDFYIFASLTADDITAVANLRDWVHRIWMDEKTSTHLLDSVDTLKASACWRTFSAQGSGITWAVLDTGIRSDHPHFQGVLNKDLSRNFSNSITLEDKNGHGSHVAGIISGRVQPKADATQTYKAATFVEEQEQPQVVDLKGFPAGVAPLTALINVKVLDDDGTGSASNAILALEYLRKLNQNCRSIRVDGANMSLGYPFDPKWYGCGHSPLCDEVQRAVDSGLVVVISCGNSGYGTTKLDTGERVPVSIGQSITDPANTEHAISVGSVHKSKPHTYGVSYFSSKGPTGDGRRKPDLVAPGEKVISCSIHLEDGYEYEERSGTSMAAPHVSGAVAAFLSVHPEFRGDPYKIKEIFLKSATDIGRSADFQGAGIVDLMRAIMSV
jgi:serine protease AprX